MAGKDRDCKPCDLRGSPLMQRMTLTCPVVVAPRRERGTKVMDTGSRITICFMWGVKAEAGSQVIPWFLIRVTQQMVH